MALSKKPIGVPKNLVKASTTPKNGKGVKPVKSKVAAKLAKSVGTCPTCGHKV